MKNLKDIQAATTSELVAFYNLHNAEKPIKKFADRPTAEKRVLALVEAVELEEAAKNVKAEVKPVIVRAQAQEQSKTVTKQLVDALEADEPKTKEKPDADEKKSTWTKGRASNAAGVAASWADPSVVAARLQRDGVAVTVDGVTTTHKSTREAFRQYRLPDSKHIRFRLKLKEAGTAVFEQGGKKYTFAII
jgi:hypothetical protein